jgi:hypothetical protein
MNPYPSMAEPLRPAARQRLTALAADRARKARPAHYQQMERLAAAPDYFQHMAHRTRRGGPYQFAGCVAHVSVPMNHTDPYNSTRGMGRQ